MAKPNVTIKFANGALGSVSASADGVVGMVVAGVAVSGRLEIGKAYVLYSLDNLTALGITDGVNDGNAYAYQCVKQFYTEAGNGSELWLMVVASSTKVSDMVDSTKDNARKLLKASKGRIRVLVALTKAAGTVTEGMDSDVAKAVTNAQVLGEWATDSLYAPILTLIEGKGYSNTAASDVANLMEGSQNRVGVVVGQVMNDGVAEGSLVAVVAGRVAKIPVQRHIGRVKDGALTINEATIDGSVSIEEADIDTLNNKGYITLRTFVGRSGYYLCDDHLATAEKDDYHSLARRRVADKAYRIAYDTLLDDIADEVACTAQGTMVAAVAKAWEADVVGAIAREMTSAGELGSDPTDSNDMGVLCEVDRNQNIVSSGRVKVAIKVKPYGYAKYIDASLGFTAVE